VSLLEEAAAATKRVGCRPTHDVLMEGLDADQAAEVRELLETPAVGESAAARVLNRHYGERAGRQITWPMVVRWRETNL